MNSKTRWAGQPSPLIAALIRQFPKTVIGLRRVLVCKLLLWHHGFLDFLITMLVCYLWCDAGIQCSDQCLHHMSWNASDIHTESSIPRSPESSRLISCSLCYMTTNHGHFTNLTLPTYCTPGPLITRPSLGVRTKCCTQSVCPSVPCLRFFEAGKPQKLLI